MAWSHLGTVTGTDEPSSLENASLEITELGMTRFDTATNRTAIGLAVNLPQFRYSDTYQIQENLTQVRGNHLFKAGLDVRRQYIKSFFFPTIHELLRSPTLDAFRQRHRRGSQRRQAAPWRRGRQLLPLMGSVLLCAGRRADGSNLTLNLGLRCGLPGNNIGGLIGLNERILDADGDDPVSR